MKKTEKLFIASFLMLLMHWGGLLGFAQQLTPEMRERLAEREAMRNRPDRVPAKIKKAASSSTIYGCIWESFGDYWTEPGIFSFNPNAPYSFTPVANGVKVFGGATLVGDKYYAIYYKEEGSLIYFPLRLTVYDANTWEPLDEYASAAMSGIASDLAYDHVTKTIYGCFKSDVEYSQTTTFGKLEFDDSYLKEYRTVPIAQFPEEMKALTFDENGQLYSFGASGQFYKVNKYNGEVTPVGEVFAGSYQFGFQSACYDLASKKIYWYGTGPFYECYLYEVDPATGAGSVVADYDSNETYEQIVGMFIKQDFPTIVLPNAVESLNATFEGTSLTGIVSFVLPSTDSEGQAITGKIGYQLLLNGQEKATGEGNAGELIVKELTVDQSGNYRFEALATLDGHASEATVVEKYIGFDNPAPVTNVTAKAGKETMNQPISIEISWTAPTASQHGGYIDLTAISYKVVRYPGAVEVASNLSQTTYTDAFTPEGRSVIYYEVTANANGMESEPTKSNEIKVGVIATCPFTENFDSEDAFEFFTIEDANRDGSTWEFQPGYAKYKYNQKNAANDWLITPPIKMLAGKLYVLEFTAMNSYPDERIAAYAGTEAKAGSLTTEIVPPTVITYSERVKTMRGTFRPETNGVYYFGIKAMSDPDMSELYVDELSVTEMSAAIPLPVSDLVVEPGAKGALSATISFTTPTTCVDGSDINTLTGVRISRNNIQIEELTNLQKGQPVVYEDKLDLSDGIHKYTVEAINEIGAGDKAEASVYIGCDIPSKVRNLKAVEDPNEEGSILISWDAPEKGQNGGYVDPAGLTYYISKGTTGDEDINNGNRTTYRDKLDVSGGKQVFEGYNVYATNHRGSGRNVWQTAVTIAGPAVKAPMVESLSGMRMLSGPWVTEMESGEIGEAFWNPVDGVYQQSGTQDNDGGLWSFTVTGIGKACRIMSPKVDISKLAKPEVSFWIYQSGATDKLDVSISVNSSDFKTIDSFTMEGEKGWHRHQYDLSEYKDSKFVRIGLTGVAVVSTGEIMSLDNVAMTEAAECNLQLMSITAPEKTYIGQEASFSVKIRNSGSKEISADSYTLQLIKNGKVTTEAEGIDIAIGQTQTIQLADIPNLNDNEKNEYMMRIECSEDAFEADNESEKVTLSLVFPDYPLAQNVEAHQKEQSVEVRWDEPDLSTASAEAVTEQFDNYSPFIIDNIGEWTTYDADGQPTIRITLSADMGPLEYLNAGMPMAFQVFNPEEAGIPFATWDPHSGKQMLVAFKCASPDQGTTEIRNDDWLISPELNGSKQTISFYAKTGVSGATEVFEVLYSESGKESKDFLKLGQKVEIANISKWEEFRYELPEGARYFAIRCISYAQFALLLDDITYIPAGAQAQELVVEGYNVYRDGVRLNESTIKETAFTDNTIEIDASYTYNVTVVYDKGESNYSADAKVLTSSITEVNGNRVQLLVGEGSLSIEGFEGIVQIYGVDGALYGNEPVNNTATFRLQPGAYIVKLGDTTHKVLVK